jgi:hypothetical protein
MSHRLASLVAAGLVGGGIVLAGCGGSHAVQMDNLVRTVALPPRGRVFHSASHRYSVHQVVLAFAQQQVFFRNVSPKSYSGLLALLDGRPTHPVYVDVEVGKFSGALDPAMRNSHVTRHGNVEVLWRPRERAAVRAALRRLH